VDNGNEEILALDLPGEDALWTWFSLSYASWLTLPRVLMHAMPDEWQGKMAALLEEYDERFCTWKENLGTRVQVTNGGKIAKTPRWLVEYRHPDKSKIDSLRGERERQ
jgi:hypothetical protein